MFSSALYTDIGQVAAALAFQSPETLASPVSAGSIPDLIWQPIASLDLPLGTGLAQITLNQVPPPDWAVGSTLILDSANPSLRESVTLTGLDGVVLTITETANAHAFNSPVINGTILANYISPASRLFDQLTDTPAGFAYESWTDIKEGYYNNRGMIEVPLSKPAVVIGDVTSATFQSNPMNPVDTLNLSQGWIRADFFLEIAPLSWYYNKSGMMTVTYMGGYNPLPADIAWAATVIAARMFKEKDSGYSDVIGNTEFGILEYKKALPADVLAVIAKYRRWVE